MIPTCCFPSIAVEKVKVTVFLPSFRFNDATCSEVGVVSLTLLLFRLDLSSFLFMSGLNVFFEESPRVLFFASLGIGGKEFLDPDLLKEKGQILQFPPGGGLSVDVSPA